MSKVLSFCFCLGRSVLKIRRSTEFFILFLLVAVVSTPNCRSQTSASISGTVRDAFAAVVPGAKVTLSNDASKAIRTTISNGVGFFDFQAVPAATYTIRIQVPGFEAWKVTGVQVHPGDSVEIPKIVLKVGAVTETVTVNAEEAGISLTSPEHGTLITAEDIQRLSTVGRDALELVTILPGFTLNGSLNNQGPDYNTTNFTSGNLNSIGANGSAPQSGQVNVTSDGAQITDPGDMAATTATINMDQVQEVKVQTANFGADEAKGPIVISAVGKSGGVAFHGSVYTYVRNHIFNSNDWQSNHAGIAKAPSKYLYPGGTLGGPVIIPGTNFNARKRLAFFTGYEYYDQLNNTNGTYAGPTYAFIPTARMLSGDLSPASLGQAFNVDPSVLAADCPNFYTAASSISNLGGDCYSPTDGTLDQNGQQIFGGKLNTISPAVATFTNLYPTPNVTPEPVASSGQLSTGYNWIKNVMASNNGFQSHSRVDESVSDSFKLSFIFNWEKINTQQPLNNIYYNPPNTIPYPTPLDSYGNSRYATINVTKTFGSTLTNEAIISGLYLYEPEQFQDRSKALDTGTPWAAAGYSGGALHNGTDQLPWIYSYETTGIPNFSFGYVPPGGQFYRKSSINVTDNLTKLFGTHTIKAGIYAEQTRSNNNGIGSQASGELQYSQYTGCQFNQTSPTANPVTNALINPGSFVLGNTVANFLVGCLDGYYQASADPSDAGYFNSFEFYATDEWKASSKLTLTYGMRFSHLAPWADAHGIGAAVWDPTKYNPISPGVLATGVTQDATTWPGISWHARDPSIPLSGIQSRALFYQPRLGLAYDLYGNGKTVFRGGFGFYRSRDSALLNGAFNTSANVLTFHLASGLTGNCTTDQLFNPAPFNTPLGGYPVSGKVVPCGLYSGFPGFSGTAASLPGSGALGNIQAMDPHDNEQPLTYNYNFTLDQQLFNDLRLEVAYVGNQSVHLSTLQSLQNQNVIPLGAFFKPDPLTGQLNPTYNIQSTQVNDYRPYPNYQQVNVPKHITWANYNALQVSLNKQRGNLVLGINYTWSKAMGVRGNYDTGTIGDPVNPRNDYGILSYDRPQVANFTYSYQEGVKFHGNRELGWFLNNWEISGITTFSSGPDLAILTSTNFGLSASAGYVATNSNGQLTSIGIPVGAQEWLGSSDYTLQPIETCDPRQHLHSKTADGMTSLQYVNGNCFALPPQGTQGWWNLTDVHGPSYFKSDLSVYKDVPINKRSSIQLRMAGFNFLNHPLHSFTANDLSALALTFQDPVCNATTGSGCLYSAQSAFSNLQLSNAGFGLTPYKAGVRILEFGAKYNF